jgi:hypothetical protein
MRGAPFGRLASRRKDVPAALQQIAFGDFACTRNVRTQLAAFAVRQAFCEIIGVNQEDKLKNF